MKKIMKRVAIAMLMAAGIFGGVAGTASAEQTAPETFPEASDTPLSGGSSIAPDNTDITIDDTAPDGGVTPFASVSVGGGTWSYGSGSHSATQKGCYSNYKHNSKYHSSAAIIGNDASTVYAKAGLWSKAYAHNGLLLTCHTYWNTY